MSKCCNCHKELSWYNIEYSCVLCGGTVCSDCIKKCEHGTELSDELGCVLRRDISVEHPIFAPAYVRLCPKCRQPYNNMIDKLSYIKSHKPYVEFVSENYHGKKRFTGERMYLETPYYRDWNDAKECLKIAAAFYDCDMLLDVGKSKDERSEETERGGTHYYSVWSYHGYAVKKK